MIVRNRFVRGTLILVALAFTGIAFVYAQTAADADFDGDGTIGFSDFLAFAGKFGTAHGDGRYEAKYDLNGDGQVGFSDFLAFAGFFGRTVPPTQVPVSEGFDLYGDNNSPFGITYANERLYVVSISLNDDGPVAGTQKVYAYSLSGQRDVASEFELNTDIFPYGIAYADGRFYVTATAIDGTAGLEKVYAFRPDGQRDASYDLNIPGDDDFPLGITYANDRFYVVVNPDDTDMTRVLAYSRSGPRDGSSDFNLFDETVENALPNGIAYAGDRFYVVTVSLEVDGPAGGAQTVFAYSRTGMRDAASDFELDADNSNPFGIAYVNNRFYVVDTMDNRIYVYRVYRE